MKPAAYCDSSVIVQILLGQEGAPALAARLQKEFSSIYAHPLLEAECLAAWVRAGRMAAEHPLGRLPLLWVAHSARMTGELATVFESDSHLRGADAFHLAVATYLKKQGLHSLVFLSLDRRQTVAAERLGFLCPC